MTDPEGTLPAELVERLRAHGATADELGRIAAEHADLPFYPRFLAAQHGATYDEASVRALLEQTRDRWAMDDSARSAFTDGATGEDGSVGLDQDAGVPAQADAGTPAAEQAVTLGDTGSAADEQVAADEALRAKVPHGTRDEVTAWVDAARTADERGARARAALAVEQTSADPRSTLIDRLEKTIQE